MRPVVQQHVPHGAGLVVDVNLFEERNERDVRDRLLVVLHPAVALGRAVMVVEGHPRRDDVEDRGPAVGDRRLDQGHDLLADAAERASEVTATERHRERTSTIRLYHYPLLNLT